MRKLIRIKNLRNDHDVTQEKIAHHLKVTQRTYSRYENADSAIPIDILIQIADYYDVSVDYLLERTDNPRKYPSPEKNDNEVTKDKKM